MKRGFQVPELYQVHHSMFTLALDALLAGGVLLLSYFLVSRWFKISKKSSLELTGGLPDPEPLHDFNLVSGPPTWNNEIKLTSKMHP